MSPQNASFRIDLAEALAPTISTRVAIQAFKNRLREVPSFRIELDFANVESISRSAAHELVVTRFDLTNVDHKTVDFTHMNSVVTDVFSTVTDNAINTKQKDRQISDKRVAFEAFNSI